MPEQIELSREVEEACERFHFAICRAASVERGYVEDFARAIIAQVREEMKDGR